MREKGFNQQQNENNNINKRTKGKKGTKRSTKFSTKIKIDFNENRKNIENDEEEDLSNYDTDKNILNKFMKEQKKEIDDFINIRKVEIKKPNTNK